MVWLCLGLGWVGSRSGHGQVTVISGQFKFSSHSGHDDVRSGDVQITVTVMSRHCQGLGQSQVTFISGHVAVTLRPRSRSRSGHGHGQITVRSRSRSRYGHGQVRSHSGYGTVWLG